MDADWTYFRIPTALDGRQIYQSTAPSQRASPGVSSMECGEVYVVNVKYWVIVSTVIMSTIIVSTVIMSTIIVSTVTTSSNAIVTSIVKLKVLFIMSKSLSSSVVLGTYQIITSAVKVQYVVKQQILQFFCSLVQLPLLINWVAYLICSSYFRSFLKRGSQEK